MLKSAAGCSAHMKASQACRHRRHGNKKKQKQSREGGGGASPRTASDAHRLAHGLPPLHLARIVPMPYLVPMPCEYQGSSHRPWEYQRQRVELERIISGVDALLANDTRAGEVGHMVDLIASALPPPGSGEQGDDHEWGNITERARPLALEWAQNPHAGRSGREDFEFESSHQLQVGSPRFFEDVAGTLVQATNDLDNMDKWDVARLVKLGGVAAEVAAAAQQLLLGGQREAHLRPGDSRERFLAHAAATAFGLTSASDGAGDTRHVVLRGPQHPASLPVPEPTAVSSIAAGRDAVLLLRELLTQLQVGQVCIYYGGSRQIPDGKMGIIDTWRQVLPQKMRECWERRCAAAGLCAPVQVKAEAQPDDKDEDDQCPDTRAAGSLQMQQVNGGMLRPGDPGSRAVSHPGRRKQTARKSTTQGTAHMRKHILPHMLIDAVHESPAPESPALESPSQWGEGQGSCWHSEDWRCQL